jgi:hypothetical protein
MIPVGSIGHPVPTVIPGLLTVIPGLDPGIPTDSIGRGDPRIDPRIKSGDGDDGERIWPSAVTPGDDGERTWPSAVTPEDDGRAIGSFLG